MSEYQPEERDPEEYDAEGEATVSPSTGTVYEGEGGDAEPVITPHDETEAAEDGDAG